MVRAQGELELFFPGSGEMARRMRAHPWGDTPLGEPADWPESLRTAVRICLTSRFPMIVWWGSELVFLYNDAYLPSLGDNHPALGKPGSRVWTDIWHIIGPMLESVMRTGEATWSQDMMLPTARHGYLEETYWTYSYSPVFGDSGEVLGVFTAVSDTTEQVVGERRLAVLHDLGAQTGRARTVAEACHLVAEVLRRAESTLSYAALHLRDPDGLRRAAASQDVTGDEPWPVAEVLASGEAVSLDDVAERAPWLTTRDWAQRPNEALVLPLTGETGGRTIGVVVLVAHAGRRLDEAYRSFLTLVARQTSDLVNAAIAYEAQQRRAEELAELDRAKTLFFSNISHEFRTPLTLIMGPLQELRTAAAAAGDERASAELEVVHRNGLRLGRLVNTLLDFSRIEAGRMRARFTPVDLGVLTAELSSVFRSAVERAGLDFEVDCPPLPDAVYVDISLWEKVVLNLLSNALKFTFDGAIRVRTAAEDGHAVVTVADSGIGVAEDELPRLFERFHRVHSARARSGEGSGIGLALVRELVGLHGGTIDAESRVGVGTTFTIRLPLGADHLPAEDVAPAGERTPSTADADPYVQEALRWLPDAGAGAGDGAPVTLPAVGESAAVRAPRRTRVLVADDNADMRDYLARLLRAGGYTVDLATDGVNAREAAVADPPDLIVSDVMMPRLDGLELVAALREEPRTAAVPVLLLSARAGQEASIEGLAAGADDYLVKPFSAAELLARVRASVQLARQRNHHTRWRTALVDSLHEGFFVCADDGSIVEANASFGDILGYGVEGLPYRPPHPWWPDPDADPDAHRRVREVFDRVMVDSADTCELPAIHRDGRDLWISASFAPLEDPETGKRVVVGTFRDITDEHHAIQRETALARLNAALSQADTAAEAVRTVLPLLRALWLAEHALAVTFRRSGDPEVFGDGGDFTGPVEWERLDQATRTAMLDVAGLPPLTPAISPEGFVAIAMEHPDGILGIRIDLRGRRRVGAEDRTLLSLLAGRLGQGVQRAHQIDQQREAALALQRAILGPPLLPIGIAARYEPATRPLSVGGDWYDTVELSDGRIGIVVGDCVGSGLPAATVMGQLRSACRALLLRSADPAQTLDDLDQFATSLPGAICTTVFCAALDTRTGHLTYASAGHPPGAVVLPDGTTRLLDGGRSVPLVVDPAPRRTAAEFVVPARATLLLYTDGLVERRGHSVDDGVDQAASALRSGRGKSIDDLADHLMGELAPAPGFDDDVALLLYRHPGPLELAFTPATGELARIRAAFGDWLDRCDIDAEQATDIMVAVGEACANSIEHSDQACTDTAVLRATATPDTLTVTVTDKGRWRPPNPSPESTRGHGLTMMRGLVDEVAIDSPDTGTTVRLRVDLALDGRPGV
ncbi:PAS domain S-box-containing protein [Actinokineospora spheciospongiae]|nr:PAS domain S-box-containing protein [Actinokineospora spheciospongiae]